MITERGKNNEISLHILRLSSFRYFYKQLESQSGGDVFECYPSGRLNIFTLDRDQLLESARARLLFSVRNEKEEEKSFRGKVIEEKKRHKKRRCRRDVEEMRTRKDSRGREEQKTGKFLERKTQVYIHSFLFWYLFFSDS